MWIKPTYDCMIIARTFENKNHIKIKITRHRFMENGCIWEGTLLMNACWVSVLFHQVLNWYGLQIAKRHFSYKIWLMISEKSIMVYTFLHHGDALTYQNSQQTRHTEKIVY